MYIYILFINNCNNIFKNVNKKVYKILCSTTTKDKKNHACVSNNTHRATYTNAEIPNGD